MQHQIKFNFFPSGGRLYSWLVVMGLSLAADEAGKREQAVAATPNSLPPATVLMADH